MNWREKEQRERQRFRLLGALTILAFLVVLLFVGFFINIPWKKLPSLFSTSPKMTLSPISDSDPVIVLTQKLEEKKIRLSSTPVATDSAIMALLSDGETIFFSTNKDIPSQVDSLQIILSRLTIEGKKFQKIDFRYDLPIITY